MKATIRNQTGISLVEVLVTVIVFAIGLLAIAQLQGQLVRGGSDAKARSGGVNLAEQQIEQFRSFTLTAGNSYDDIVDRTENNALTNTVSGVQYELWWEVDEYHFPDGSGTAVLGADASGNSDFKMIRIHADWTDESGNDQGVFVEDIIANSPPSDVLRTVQGSPPSEAPIVRYKDTMAAPEVMEVDMGDGFSKQTSKPEPEIVGSGPNVLTSFDAITFSNTLLEGFPVLQRREEFLAINCRCTQNGEGVGRTPAVWTESGWQGGVDVTKRVGVPLSGLDQPFICDRCCRDHHDITDEAQFDPFRPTGNDANDNPFYPSGLGGDHGHFIFDSDTGQLVPADATGDEYLEACTFTRIEGIFQTAPDFRLENVTVLPIEFLQSSSGLTSYQAFIVQFVKEYAEAIANQSPRQYPAVTPNMDLDDTENNDASATLEGMWNSFPASVAPPAEGSEEGRRFLARGIYINFMSDELLDRIECRLGGGSDCDDLGEESGPVLPLVPFQELNVTRLATWSVDDAGSSSIYVTNDALTTSNEDTFDRGRAINCAPYTPTDGSAEVTARCDENNATIFASLLLSNTGLLANANSTDTDDKSLNADSILIDFDLPPEPPPRTVKGSFGLQGAVKGVEMNNITVAGSAGITCSRPEPTTYSCVFDDLTASGTITFGNYNSVDRQGNILNHVVCPAGEVFNDGTTIVTNMGPVDDGTATETTPFSFVDMPADEFTLDITIKKNGC